MAEIVTFHKKQDIATVKLVEELEDLIRARLRDNPDIDEDTVRCLLNAKLDTMFHGDTVEDTHYWAMLARELGYDWFYLSNCKYADYYPARV